MSERDQQHRDPVAYWWQVANRVAKWRKILASWQVGTRPESDGETRAIKDHREITLLMRAELNAVVWFLQHKLGISEYEWVTRLTEELEHLDNQMEKKFPGFRSTDEGIEIDLAVAQRTMKDLNFPP
jgi:hypothetical protein